MVLRVESGRDMLYASVNRTRRVWTLHQHGQHGQHSLPPCHACRYDPTSTLDQTHHSPLTRLIKQLSARHAARSTFSILVLLLRQPLIAQNGSPPLRLGQASL